MKQQNYLDIYPSTGIARQFPVADLLEPAALKKLIADIDAYINTMEQDNVKFLNHRQQSNISSSDTYKFFRSQERLRNSRLILQYLVTFLTKLPLQKDIDEKVINPFQQLKSFARLSINLLKENDVTEAILKEHERLGLLNETNAWYYKGQISKNYKEILEVLEKANVASVEDYCLIFEALHRLSLFWFSVRNENLKRVRRSDLFLYKLTLLLLHRYGRSE